VHVPEPTEATHRRPPAAHRLGRRLVGLVEIVSATVRRVSCALAVLTAALIGAPS
jgi:hypothetical protein